MKLEDKKRMKMIFIVILAIAGIIGLCYCGVVAYVFIAYERSTEMQNYRNMQK